MKSEKPKKSSFKVILLVLCTVLMGSIYWDYANKDNNINAKTFSDFIVASQNAEIDKVDVIKRSQGNPAIINVIPKEGIPYSVEGEIDVPFIEKLTANNVEVQIKSEPQPSLLYSILLSILPVVLIILAMFFLFKMGSGGGGIMKIGKNKSQQIDPKDISVTFDSVKGCDEAKLEAREIVDFLKSPDKFKKLGAKIPRGLLLIGPPGTGKTLIASAIAKEAQVPFFSLAGSEFVEMYVGVGAARVRDLFSEAKKVAPCIIFIDEIDSIAGSRNGQGNNEERENTLNQILVEMDGLKNGQKDIIVIGATNMPDKLDKALRPGRFDRRIYVDLPDVKGREEILKLYTKDIPLDINVNLRKIALYTAGLAGAELNNVVNEACILAARDESKYITQKHLQEGYDKMSMGVERKNNSLSDTSKLKTAYHEAGHAVVSMMLDNHMELHKVTIIPRGKSLGLTRFLPEEDKMYSMQREEIIDQITSTLGGRAAEMLFFNTLTSGASHDIQVATLYSRNMVTKYGMSKVGPVAYNSNNENNGYGFNISEMSESNRKSIEDEVLSIIRSCEEKAMDILSANRDLVIRMTQALIDLETIEAYHIYNLKNNLPLEDEHGIAEYYRLTAEKEKAKLEKFGIHKTTDSIVDLLTEAKGIDSELIQALDKDNKVSEANPKSKINPVEFTEQEFKKRRSIFDLLGITNPIK